MGVLASLKRSSVVHLMFAITFFTSGLIINLFQCILYIGLRPFSKYLYRKLNYYLCYSFYSQLVFMAEWWSGTDVICYINKEEFDKYYGNEHGYLLMNHSYEIDWLVGWMFCERIQMLGNCKAYAKKSIQYIPTLGWAWKFAESVFLERSWEKDKETIGEQIRELADYPDTMWLLLYAEGTRFTPEKHEASQKFAHEKGLPVLKHHLTPRTKGFTASLPHLRGKVGAIYDIQLAFKPTEVVKPTMTNLLLGEKVEAHMYINRIPLAEVPEGDEAAAAWLHQIYQKKDRMAESFMQTGDFFATSGVPPTGSFKLERRYYSLINTTFWAIVVLVPMLYYLVNLLLSGSTVYFFIGVGIILLFFLLMYKTIGMSEISKSSSYGSAESKKPQ
ncbi:1-acyl-sn-glycerol-3-phosphate acyltransferase gamma isoform X1 [Neodiprion pinetum]|uniref:1-acyl-sn-glycerol-3-phosphate acyltransferase gamma isoform X1 n=2 Tax=Neodiprion lecontei TaxID=441921 RepID=A0A6J0BGM1_NEOLC|nr:1-acyl-sn-glycerol-3-phosphate acyltransferase gamma isoform X1 [Neodiprion lecontei]XP_046414639.1 1-acyl-sn-glycerol-3-phosphate acyltransferase gamma-like isoform X1 [Neodiprion fabricii]XP_046414640.1 1-acyl-sn-glycerol-3-phosphate acyltransferase gamma-like isoform X1 [Neodiprion fabricii]XP_046466036.1 1-acyl-sn-glycerol-3-phosphate acyltransferase gamma-like isoform X1 [Neodiprion pinetum]XP_046466037.1 1-acyl-sn-glycerol-3-phosphate acyltransferase gamma-like isoform X1 [Neodiprion p